MNEQFPPYLGKAIIAPNSFLRKLPQIVSKRQRLANDAMVIASDIVDLNYSRLREMAIEVGADASKIDEKCVTVAISSAWAMAIIYLRKQICHVREYGTGRCFRGDVSSGAS
jgi:hypothetical protein